MEKDHMLLCLLVSSEVWNQTLSVFSYLHILYFIFQEEKREKDSEEKI